MADIPFTPAEFNPVLKSYTNQGAFRFWCQTVLPLIYDDSLSYYELLNKMVVYLNNVIKDMATAGENIDALNEAYENLQKYVNDEIEMIIGAQNDVTGQFNGLQDFVNDYFENLDIQQEINEKLDAMAAGGTLSALIAPIVDSLVPSSVTTWLTEHVDPVGSAVVVDDTLTISGAAADAKVAGDRINNVENITELIEDENITWYDGYFADANGALVANANYSRSNYIPVIPKSKLFIGTSIAGGARICFYDYNKNFVNSISPATSSQAIYKYEQTVEEGCYYVIVSCRTIQVSNAYLKRSIANDVVTNYFDILKVKNEINSEYIYFEHGNFSGSNLWQNTSDTSYTVARSNVLENFGNCAIRSITAGVLITVYAGSSQIEGSELIAQGHTVVYLDGVYNYVRIRVQSGTTDLRPIGNYLNNLIAVEKYDGISYRLDQLDRDFKTISSSVGSFFEIANTDIETDTEYNVTLPAFNPNNIVARIESKYTSTDSNEYKQPYIYCQNGWGSYTSAMGLGKKDEYVVQYIRFYPFIIPNNLTLNIRIIVPENLTLNIRTLQIYFDSNTDRDNSGLTITAHTGFRNTPPYSKRAVSMISLLGAKKIVTIPKRSSDGVWFCYHDDTFDIHSTFIRNADGSAIEDSTYNNQPFSNIPFNYLNSLDWGVSTNAYFAGEKPMLLEDFFSMCAKTGMHPAISCHPSAQNTQENFQEIKNLTNKYNLTDKLTIKMPYSSTSSITGIAAAVAIFGYKIEEYVINMANNVNPLDAINNLVLDILDPNHGIPLCIEQFAGSSYATANDIANIKGRRCVAGIASGQHNRIDGTSGTVLTSIDLNYFMNMGVTEFTDNSFSSFGLNW